MRKADNLPPSCAVVTKPGNLNFLEPPGPFWVCNGTDLPLLVVASGVPWDSVRGVGSTNSIEDRGQRERGSRGDSPLVRGSGGSCNLVQEISFHFI